MKIFTDEDYKTFSGKEVPYKRTLQDDFDKLTGSNIIRLAFHKNGQRLNHVTKPDLTRGKELDFLVGAAHVGTQPNGNHVTDDWYRVAEQIVKLDDDKVLVIGTNTEIIPTSYSRDYRNSTKARTFRKHGNLITLKGIKNRAEANEKDDPQFDLEKKVNMIGMDKGNKDEDIIGQAWWGTPNSTGNRKITLDHTILGVSLWAYVKEGLTNDKLEITAYIDAKDTVAKGGQYVVKGPSRSKPSQYVWILHSVPLSGITEDTINFQYANVYDLSSAINTLGNIMDELNTRHKEKQYVFAPQDVAAYLSIMNGDAKVEFRTPKPEEAKAKDVKIYPWIMFGQEGFRIYGILTNQMAKIYWKDDQHKNYGWRRLGDGEVNYLMGKVMAWYNHETNGQAFQH